MRVKTKEILLGLSGIFSNRVPSLKGNHLQVGHCLSRFHVKRSVPYNHHLTIEEARQVDRAREAEAGWRKGMSRILAYWLLPQEDCEPPLTVCWLNSQRETCGCVLKHRGANQWQYPEKRFQPRQKKKGLSDTFFCRAAIVGAISLSWTYAKPILKQCSASFGF